MLSVVVPLYDEAEVLPIFLGRLRPALDGLGEPYEVVAVDDGSHDTTPVLLERAARDWPQLRVLRLRVNAGHQAALSAGLVRARGDRVVTIDGDLQDPPELVPDLVSAARRDAAEVVYAVRTDRTVDSPFKRATAALFYRIARRIAGFELPRQAGDYRLMSRVVVDAVNRLPEQHRVLRLAVPALGFPSTHVGFERAARAAGRSKYGLRRMVGLALDGLTGVTVAPLRAATWCGFGAAVVSVLLVAYALVSWLSGHALAGWTSTMAVVAAVGAVQLLCVGLLGEYVGRLFVAVQDRATYHVASDSLDGATPEPHAADADAGAPARDAVS